MVEKSAAKKSFGRPKLVSSLTLTASHLQNGRRGPVGGIREGARAGVSIPVFKGKNEIFVGRQYHYTTTQKRKPLRSVCFYCTATHYKRRTQNDTNTSHKFPRRKRLAHGGQFSYPVLCKWAHKSERELTCSICGTTYTLVHTLEVMNETSNFV